MTKLSKHFLYIFLVLGTWFTLTLFTGCTAPRELAEQQTVIDAQARELDSLRTVEHRLWGQLKVLRDSLQFYDDIDSGKYYRELRTLNDEIERLEYNLAVSRDGGRTVSVIPTDDLFEPASAKLTENGGQKLDELAQKLSNSFEGRIFRIEGHSDNVPVGPSLQEIYPSNWELSAARAAAVVRYLIEKHEMTPEQFEISSFSMTKPIASNGTSDGRRQNRRIRVAVLPEAVENE